MKTKQLIAASWLYHVAHSPRKGASGEFREELFRKFELKPEFTKTIPVELGLYWWWNEDEDSNPIVVDIAYSGTSNSCFAMQGQHGWTRYQDVEEMGGWWAPITIPAQPKERAE